MPDATTKLLCPWDGCEGHLVEVRRELISGPTVQQQCDTCDRLVGVPETPRKRSARRRRRERIEAEAVSPEERAVRQAAYRARREQLVQRRYDLELDRRGDG